MSEQHQNKIESRSTQNKSNIDKITYSYLEELRENALLKNQAAMDFQRLFQSLNIDILSFWREGYSLTATPEGWAQIPLDMIKRTQEHGRDPILSDERRCPECDSKKIFFRKKSQTWICYDCKSIFQKDRIPLKRKHKSKIARW